MALARWVGQPHVSVLSDVGWGERRSPALSGFSGCVGVKRGCVGVLVLSVGVTSRQDEE